MSQNVLKGMVQTYDLQKRVGMIFSENRRYWFHRDRIIRGPLNPAVGDEVYFELSLKPALPGKLHVAINIVIIENPTDLLAAEVR